MRLFIRNPLPLLSIVVLPGITMPAEAARIERGLSVMVPASGGPSADRTGRIEVARDPGIFNLH